MTYPETTATAEELATADWVEVDVNYDAEVQMADGSWRFCLVGGTREHAEDHAKHYSGDWPYCRNRRVVQHTSRYYCWGPADRSRTTRVEITRERVVVSEHTDAEVTR